MSDETDDDDLPQLDVQWDSEGSSEYVQCSTCQVIAPAGWEVAAAKLGAVLFRIQEKTGDVEVLESLDKPWRQAGKADRPSTVRAVK